MLRPLAVDMFTYAPQPPTTWLCHVLLVKDILCEYIVYVADRFVDVFFIWHSFFKICCGGCDEATERKIYEFKAWLLPGACKCFSLFIFITQKVLFVSKLDSPQRTAMLQSRFQYIIHETQGTEKYNTEIMLHLTYSTKLSIKYQ